MKNELTLRIELTPEKAHALLVAALLAVFPAAVGSETVTLQTYYPAPYGYFTQLRSNGLTTLAEAPGTFMGIGTTDPQLNKLRVVGTTRFEGNSTVVGNHTVTVNSSVSGTQTVGGTLGVNGSAPGTSYHSTTMALAATGRIAATEYVYGVRYAPAAGNGTCGVRGAGGTCSNGYATYAPGVRSAGVWWGGTYDVSSDYLFWTQRPQTKAGTTNDAWRTIQSLVTNTTVNWFCCNN